MSTQGIHLFDIACISDKFKMPDPLADLKWEITALLSDNCIKGYLVNALT